MTRGKNNFLFKFLFKLATKDAQNIFERQKFKFEKI